MQHVQISQQKAKRQGAAALEQLGLPGVEPVAPIACQPELPTLGEALEQGEDGMARSLDHAEAVAGFNWGDAAFDFLRDYAASHARFISEDVSEASRGKIAQPPTDRAWGAIYKRAQKDGVIRQNGSGRSRRRHGSICPLWESLLYSEDAA